MKNELPIFYGELSFIAFNESTRLFQVSFFPVLVKHELINFDTSFLLSPSLSKTYCNFILEIWWYNIMKNVSWVVLWVKYDLYANTTTDKKQSYISQIYSKGIYHMCLIFYLPTSISCLRDTYHCFLFWLQLMCHLIHGPSLFSIPPWLKNTTVTFRNIHVTVFCNFVKIGYF